LNRAVPNRALATSEVVLNEATDSGGPIMPDVLLVIVIAVLAQGVTTESFFRENEEAVVYTYRPDMDRKGLTSKVPVAASFASFVDYEKAASAGDMERCRELERRGDVFWVESGTRCRVIRGGGMAVGSIVRSSREIRLVRGQQQVRNGCIDAKHLRPYSRIRVEPPVRYTDENQDSPRPLALALQAQDKVAYRELIAARDKAMNAAEALPRSNRQRLVRYRVFRQEHQAVLDRYELDEATALRILAWGKEGNWPTKSPTDSGTFEP
jgi:hypothetical protein